MFAILALSVSLMAACGQKGGAKDKVEETTGQAVADDGTNNKAEEEVIAMINAIYDDVDMVYSTSSEPDAGTDIDLMAKYGSKKFFDLVQQIRKIDAGKSEDNRYIADWDVLLCYWDVGVCQPTDISVTIDGNTAKVNYDLYYSGQYATYIMNLVKEDGQWRIDDILQIANDTGSKVEQMAQYIKENS